MLYSDDDGVAKFAMGCGLAVKRVADLPVPASQQALPFSDRGALSIAALETEDATNPASAESASESLQAESQPATGEPPKPAVEDESSV